MNHPVRTAEKVGASYIGTLVTLYHDSFPPSPLLGPRWPHPPGQVPPEILDTAISEGFLLCGTPEEIEHGYVAPV